MTRFRSSNLALAAFTAAALFGVSGACAQALNNPGRGFSNAGMNNNQFNENGRAQMGAGGPYNTSYAPAYNGTDYGGPGFQNAAVPPGYYGSSYVHGEYPSRAPYGAANLPNGYYGSGPYGNDYGPPVNTAGGYGGMGNPAYGRQFGGAGSNTGAGDNWPPGDRAAWPGNQLYGTPEWQPGSQAWRPGPSPSYYPSPSMNMPGPNYPSQDYTSPIYDRDLVRGGYGSNASGVNPFDRGVIGGYGSNASGIYSNPAAGGNGTYSQTRNDGSRVTSNGWTSW